MPKTVRERTAEWAKEAKRAEAGDRAQVLMFMGLAGLAFMSVTGPELGWGYLGGAALMLGLMWRRARPRGPRAT